VKHYYSCVPEKEENLLEAEKVVEVKVVEDLKEEAQMMKNEA